MGVFAAAELVQEDLIARYGVVRVGRCEGVEEQFFAIGTVRTASVHLGPCGLDDFGPLRGFGADVAREVGAGHAARNRALGLQTLLQGR